MDADGTNETRLTNNPAGDKFPVWSPDGQKIAFESLRDGPIDIYVMDADGTNERRLADNPATRYHPAWSPDGEQMAFLGSPADGPGIAEDIYVIDEDGTNETRLTKTNYDPDEETHLGWPVWSPDGNKIAFASSTYVERNSSASADHSSAPASAPAEGMTGIYMIDVDGAGLCKLTSTGAENDADASPSWSPDGAKIAFYNTNVINVINADGSGRKELTGAVPDLSVSAPAWSPDGERIALLCPGFPPGTGGINLCVMNADGTEWKRLAFKVAPEEVLGGVSWGRG